jgi:cytochrome c oxidase cbb3-type subunit 4
MHSAINMNDIRIGITVLSLAIFLGLVAWAWSARRRPGFEAAARLPLEGGDE